MPQVYFDLNVFKGRPVNTSFAARRHAFLEYETYNIDKMDLTPGEREVATKQIVQRLNTIAQSWVGDGTVPVSTEGSKPSTTHDTFTQELLTRELI